MESHISDSLDQVIKQDEVQSQQSKFDRLMEQLERIENILQIQDQKQCLLDKKLTTVTNFDSLLDKKLSTMAHFDNILDKKLLDITKLDNLLDKKILSITNSDDLLDKKLSNITHVDNLLNKKLSDVTNVDSLLDKKLCDLTNAFQQENVAMLREIKETQNEILGYLCGMQPPADVAVSQVPTLEAETTHTAAAGHLTPCDCECADNINETKETLGKVDHKTITQTILRPLQKCHNIGDSGYQIESQHEKNTVQQEGHDRAEIEHVLAEIYSIPELVRGQTRAELAWLDSQIDHKLSAMEASFSDNLQFITREISKQTVQSEWIVNTLNEKEEILQRTKSSVNSRSERFDTMIAVIKNIEELQFSLDDRQKLMTDELVALSLRQDNLSAKIEQRAQDVKNYIYKTKREIFAVTEKEAQIVRDRIEGPLACHGEYLFDFYVDNFKMLVRSERDIHSPPWHINEMKSTMMGMVWFPANGQMEVCFVFARHPREVGLQPRPEIKLKMKATICDIHKKTLPYLDVGEKLWTVNERNIACNFDWGCKLGMLSCDYLLQQGYSDKEEYRSGALLIRFYVKVC